MLQFVQQQQQAGTCLSDEHSQDRAFGFVSEGRDRHSERVEDGLVGDITNVDI